MLNYYLYNLFNQFKASQGFQNVDLNSLKFQNEFIEWLKIQRVCSEVYQKALVLSDIPYYDIDSIEVGKGKYDSIAFNNSYGKLVTEHTLSFGDDFDSERIINSRIHVNSNGCPYAFISDKSKRSHEFIPLDTNLIYTQNIYNAEDLYVFVRLHNYGNNIVIGAYGKIGDKDRIQKIEDLRKLKKDLLKNSYNERYIFSGDDYVYFIQSKAKCMKKVKDRLKKEHLSNNI